MILKSSAFRNGERLPALAYPAHDLEVPISDSNQDLHDLATSYLDRQLPRRKTAFTTQVRQTIEALLGTGTCGHRHVATAMYMHPRTLQRRLKIWRGQIAHELILGTSAEANSAGQHVVP